MMLREEKLTFKKVAIRAALKAGSLQARLLAGEQHVRFKGEIDLVTEVDLKSERLILAEIGKSFPDHDVLSEEGGTKEQGSKYLWVVDPLDGTTNFAHGLTLFAVSIALLMNGKALLGVVYDPSARELFIGEAGQGAELNGRPIRVSRTQVLGKALLATGFPYYVHDKPGKIFRYFESFYLKTQGVRRLGAAALDLCYVACGRIDGFWEAGLKPWDTAAASLIVSEAGGTLSRFDGGAFENDVPQVVASNGLIHQEMLAIIKKVNTQNQAREGW